MLIKDLHPSKIPTGHWSSARNIIHKNNALYQEPGLSKFTEEFDDSFIGAIKMNEDFVVFTVGVTSGIYRVSKTGTVTPIVVDDALNFSIDNPIYGVFQRNYKREVIIAWWDGVEDTSNPPRVLNIDDVPFALNPDFSLVNPDDIDLLNLFRNVAPPKITLNSVNNTGGSLVTGTYSVFVFYELDDGTRTSYEIVGNVINIYSRSITNNYDAANDLYVFEGNDGGEATTKSVNISLTNIDTRYKNVGIGLIGKQNGIVVSFIDNIKPITSASMDFLITGNTTTVEDVSIDEIITPSVIYTGARSGTVFDKELYLFNLKVDSPLSTEFQEIANEIEVRYYFDEADKVGLHYQDSLVGYKHPEVVYDRRTYQPGEVYALYVGFVTPNGEFIHHIPGRVARPSIQLNHHSDEGTTSADPVAGVINVAEDDLISDVIAANPGVNLQNLDEAVAVDPNAKVFHFFDTCTPIFDDLVSGLPGYWENANEVYGDDFPDFAGEKVRHHRMPDIDHLRANYGFHNIDLRKADLPLGLRFQNINIPVSLQSEVLAIKFYYAARGSVNSTVICNSALMSHDQSGLNFSDLNGSCRFQDMNLLINKPTLSASYLKVHYHALTDSLGTLTAFVTLYSTLENGTNTLFRPLRSVTKSVYLPHDVNAPDADNTEREETIYVEFNDQIIIDTYPGAGTDFRILMGSLMKHQVDMYIDYANQELVFTGGLIYLGETECVAYGGDVFVTPYSHRQIYLTGDINDIAQIVEIPVYSLVNNWLRQSDGLSIFHPFDTSSFLQVYNINYFEYNYDYTAVNNFFPYRELVDEGLDQATIDRVTKFPYRIARSVKQNDESTTIGWRTFLANDYYENVRRVGVGVAIRTLSKTLIIQFEFGLFIAVARDKLSANNIEVSLGSGDIFQSAPDEIIPEDSGYFGSRHQASCIVTKAGYVAVDDVQGKVIIFNGSANEITTHGIRDFMIKNAPCAVSGDNPYLGIGWLSGFDEENNRILITKWFGLSNPEHSLTSNFIVFTLSYNLDEQQKGWIALHDYAPSFYLFNRTGLFSLRNYADGNFMWKHNADNIATYYTEQIKESYVDYVVSSDEFFKLFGIEWDSIAWNPNTGVHNEFETVSKVAVFNDKQCTGITSLIYDPVRSLALTSKNVSPYRNRWTYNKVRDIVKDRTLQVINDKDVLNTGNFDTGTSFNKKLKLTGKFCIIRFVWSNTSQTRIELYNVSINARKVQ